LNQVSVRYFPDDKRSLDLTEVLRRLHGSGDFVLDAAIVGPGQPDGDPLQAAFDIRALPALVVSAHVPGVLDASLADPKDMRGYAVIDDEAALHDPARLPELVENLCALLAASSSGEMRSALRTRRFGKLVWTASSRAGHPIDYLSNARVRFGLGSTSTPFAFDDAGWARETAPQQRETAEADVAGDTPFGTGDGVDMWDDDGGAGAPTAGPNAMDGEHFTSMVPRPRPVLIR
jgi:hypothetical protein